LRHLLPGELDEPVVDPVARVGLRPVAALRLGNLVLVMRKDEVLPAAVQVERRPEAMDGHRGALDVPTGASGAPWALPRGLARFRRLPQREVGRVAFAVVDLDPRARPQLLRIAFAEA